MVVNPVYTVALTIGVLYVVCRFYILFYFASSNLQYILAKVSFGVRILVNVNSSRDRVRRTRYRS